MNGLMLCGGQAVSKDELSLIPIPPKTDTYTPVGHYELAKRIETVSQDLLRGFELVTASYGVAREGRQLFAVLTFQNGEKEQGLSIGFRNSLDKSMTLGIVCGSTVFVCSNLQFRGDIEHVRKHTGDVWGELEDRLMVICYKSSRVYEKIIDNTAKLKALPMDNRHAFQVMGELYGEDIISPRQLTAMKSEWMKPSYEPFKDRNAWSLYNDATHSLKTSPPQQVIEDHTKLSKFFDSMIIEAEYVDATYQAN